jgi:hypothetical protein
MVVHGQYFPIGISLALDGIQTFRKKMGGILKGDDDAYFAMLHGTK